MKKLSKKELAKLFAYGLFGVGFVAPLTFANIAQAANFGKGESGTVQWLSDAVLTKTDATKWATTTGTADANYVVFHGVKFKIVATVHKDTTDSGITDNKNALVTLWSYDTSLSKSAYNLNLTWGGGSKSLDNPERAYAKSNLLTAMASLYTSKFEEDERIQGVTLKYDSSTKEQKADGSGDLEDQFVWAPSVAEMNSWTSTAAQRQISSKVSSWLRSPNTGSYNLAYVVKDTGDIANNSKVVQNSLILRPALQILNQQTVNYVFQTHSTINDSGVLSADTDSGTYTGYEATSDTAPTFTPSSGITLEGTNIKFTATATGSYTAAGLLTTNGGTTWAEINTPTSGDTGDIAYMAKVSNDKLDLQNVTAGTDYALKVFGMKDTNVTELSEGAITGLSVVGSGADAKIHMKIGSYGDVTYNSGVTVTLSNGAVADAAGTVNNTIVVSTGGILNLSGLAALDAATINGGTLNISGTSASSQAITGTGGTLNVTGSYGNLYGGYSQYGSATSNEVTMSGGSVSGNVYGGYVYWGKDNTGNSVIITGGTYAGTIYGGYSNQKVTGGDTANLGNKVTIRSTFQGEGQKTGNIQAVYGGRGDGASYNNVTIESSYTGTVTGDSLAGSVVGGYSIKSKDSSGSGNSTHNSVSISGGTYQKFVIGGYAYAASGENVGNAKNNTVIISGGIFEKGVHAGWAAGAIGNAENNSIIISGGTFVGSIYAGYSANGSSTSGNTITITGESAKFIGTYGTMQADSAVTLGGTFTVGAGETASSLTVTNGIIIDSNDTGALVGGSSTKISNLAGNITNEGTLTVSNLLIVGNVADTGTLNLNGSTISGNLSLTDGSVAFTGNNIISSNGSGVVYGVQALSGTNTISATDSGTNIVYATSTGGDVRSVSFGDGNTAGTGTTTISGLSSVTAIRNEGSGTYNNAYGIYSKAGEGANFSATVGTISATSAEGNSYGICFNGDSVGTSTISGLTYVTSKSTKEGGRAHGINAMAGENNVTFNNGTITAITTAGKAYGISYGSTSDVAIGNTTITGLKSITAQDTAGFAYGICANGTGNIAVKGVSSNYKAWIGVSDNANSAKVYLGANTTLNLENFDLSIGSYTNAYTVKTADAATTLNLKDSNLAGKIAGGTDSALTINFSGTSAWTATDSDIVGKVNTVNEGILNYTGDLFKDIGGTSGTTVLISDTVKATTAGVEIAGILNGNDKTVDMQDGQNTTLTVGKLAGTTNMKIDLDMSDTTKVDTLSIGAAESGAILNLNGINITKDYVVTSGGTITVPTDVANGITYVTGDGAASGNLTYKINGKTKTEEGSSLQSSIASSNYVYTFTLGEAGKLNYKISAASGNLFKDFIEGKLTEVPQTLSVTEDLADATADMSVNTTYSELNIYVNDGKKLGTATGNVVTIADGDTLNLNGGATIVGIVYTGWNVAEGGTLKVYGKVDMNGAVTGAGSLVNMGTLTIAGAKLQVDTENNGILNPTDSTFGADITGTGIINFNSEFSLLDGRQITQDTITVAGGKNLYLRGTSIQMDKFIAGSSDSTGDSQGLYIHSGANTVTFSGENCSVEANTIDGKAMGIFYVAKDGNASSVNGLKKVMAETTATVAGKNAFGINVTNKNDASLETDTFLVSFATDNGKGLGTISVYSAIGENHGICIASGSTGKTKIENLQSVSAGVKSDNSEPITSGLTYGIDVAAGVNYITFSGENTSITAKSTGAAFGIFVSGGNTTVTGDATNKTGISVTGNNDKGSAAVYVTGGTLILNNFDLSDENSRVVVDANGKLDLSNFIFGDNVYMYNLGSLDLQDGVKLGKDYFGAGVTNIIGSVDANGVTISQSKLSMTSSTAALSNVTNLMSKELNITAGTLTGSTNGEKVTLYGNYVSSPGDANDSVINITGSASVTGVNAIKAGHALDGNSNNNKITVTTSGTVSVPEKTGGDTDTVAVMGGYAHKNGNTENNTVTITTGSYHGDIYGGYALFEDSAKSTQTDLGWAKNNKVTIEDQGTVYNNISAAVIFGGKGTNGASGNTVILSAANLVVSGDRSRDVSVAGGCARERGDASDNTVNISSGVYKESVYGGWAADFDGDGVSGNAENNRVNIFGGTFYGNIYAGLSEKGNTSGNTITITGTEATYLGSSGTIKADSEVVLGDGTTDTKFTIGNGTDTVALTFASGLDAKAKSTLDIKANSAVTLQGTSTLNGTVTGAGSVKNTGTLNASLDKFADLTKFENAGTLNLQGQLTGDINGSGTTILGEDQIINANRKVEGILDANGKTINMQEGAGTTAAYSTLEVGALSNTANLKIDVNLNESKSDYLKIGAAGTDAKVNVTSVNVAVDATTMADGTITFADNVEGITYSVEGGQIATTTGYYTYVFTNGTVGGKLNYTMDAQSTTVKDFITGGMVPPITTFTLVENTTDGNTGTFEQGPDTLNIYVGEYNFGAEGSQATISVGEDKTMNLNGKGGTVYTNWDVDGDLNISGTITMEGQVTGDGDLNNTGTLSITADKLDIATTNTDGTINLGAGTLSKAITDGTLNIIDDVTTDADNIQSTTNNVTEGKVLTLTGGTLSKALTGDIKNTGTLTVTGTVKGKIDNDGTLNLNSEYTNEDTAIDNDGTLNVIADNLKAEVANENGTVNLGSGTLSEAITGGTVQVTGAVNITGDVTGKVSVENGAAASFYWTDYSQVEQLSGSGAINICQGTIDDTLYGQKVASGAKLTLLDNGTYRTAAVNVFEEADTTTTASGAVLEAATDKFNFVGGILEITDSSFTLDYLNSATTAVHSLVYSGVNSVTKLKMDGILVDAEKVEKPITTEQAAAIGEQVEMPKVTVKAEEGKNNTLIGSATSEPVTLGETTYKDKQAEGFNVNKLDLAEGSSGLVITNDKAVVLGGSTDEEGSKKSNIISVGGSDDVEVNVVVGVAKDKQIEGTTSTKGTLGIGIEGSTNKNGYQLKGNLTVNEDSEVKINADVQVTGNVTLDNASLTGTTGTITTVGGTLNIRNTSEIGGVVKVSDLDLDDSSLKVMEGAKVETKTLKAGSTLENGKQSSIVGEVTVTDTMTVRDSDINEESVTILVGDEDNKGVLSVGKIQLHGQKNKKSKGVIFADPAWKEGGENPISEASNIATATTALDGSYIAGQNSVIAFGTTDTEEAIKIFDAGTLTWGNGENEITAAMYIAQNISLISEDGEYAGDITVDGSLLESPGAQSDYVANFAANSLLMVDGNICMEEAAISNVGTIGYYANTEDIATKTLTEGVASSAKLYIANAIIDTTYKILAGDGVEDSITLWDTDNIILSDILDVDTTGVENNVYYVTTKAAEQTPDYLHKTTAGAAYEVMRKADKGTEAAKFMSAACDAKLSETDKIAILNRNADLPEELGVMHNHFNVTNISADAVAKHLTLNEHTQGREIWAEAIHSKENVSGLGLASQGNSYDTQYNGTVVGVDLMDNGKTTLGAAITYIDGKASNAGSHNEGKYYGATLYGRTRLGKDAGVQYDINYTHSKNELDMYSGCSYGQITGDQKVNSFSIGARFEKELRTGRSSSFVPHIGARWLRMKAGSFTNSLGNSYSPDATNSLIVPLGLSFKASMHSEGWKMSFLGDVGYQWNAGNRDYRQHFSYNGAGNSFDVGFADSNSWYAGMGFEFNKKNFTAGVGYRYAKGESTRQNKWSVNMSWAF